MSKESTAENLALIIALANEELITGGVEKEKASDLAIKICDAIRSAIGGAYFYVPKGVSLDSAIQANKIWNDYRGNNIEELSKKYDLSTQRIYQIIKSIREIKRKEIQPDLFT